jgi:2-haloacid dehalogenase
MAARGVIFDAYGTLLDVHSAMARFAERIGPNWPQISALWRAKQLEYTWIRSLAGPAQHRDFAEITDTALAFAAEAHGITDPALLIALRSAYRELSAYPEAADTLRAIRAEGVSTAILSNGEPHMLKAGIRAAGLDLLLDEVLSVESVGIFKPDPRVYQHAIDRLGGEASKLVFVSSNAWDAYGAHCCGLRVVWCNRAAQPDEYGLRRVAAEVADLRDLAISIT